jgi:hypothetical protein
MWRSAKLISIKRIRKAIDAWRACSPVQTADDEDLAAALEAVRARRLLFWNALLVGFGATRRCAVPTN